VLNDATAADHPDADVGVVTWESLRPILRRDGRRLDGNMAVTGRVAPGL
jgi:hypothetical protein